MMDAVDLAKHLRTEFGADAMEVLTTLETGARINLAPTNKKCMQQTDQKNAMKIMETYAKARELLECCIQ